MKEIRVARPLFPGKTELLQDIATVLETGRLMNGPFAAKFEEKVAEYLGVGQAISVNSCTTALQIVLSYLGVEGGEVILPTNTFIATANAVLFARGKPVLADIKEGTYFLDPAALAGLISAKTRAVIAVHLAGYVPPEIEAIQEICQERGIPLIEDCAHATGASYKGKMAGTFGLAGCFSFYPTKIISTGTGGMIITRDADLAEYSRSVRLHGSGTGLTDIVNLGNDWFLDEIRCCLGLNQMHNLPQFLKIRKQIAKYYDKLLQSTEVIKKLPINKLSEAVYYKYPVQVVEDIDVACLKKDFNRKYGFELESVYWPTVHLQPLYKRLFGYREGTFPVAEATLSRQITLPIHAAMTIEEAEYAFNCLIYEIEPRLKVVS